MGLLSQTEEGYRSNVRSDVRRDKKGSGFVSSHMSYMLALRVRQESEEKRLLGNAVFRTPLFANVPICILVMYNVP